MTDFREDAIEMLAYLRMVARDENRQTVARVAAVDAYLTHAWIADPPPTIPWHDGDHPPLTLGGVDPSTHAVS